MTYFITKGHEEYAYDVVMTTLNDYLNSCHMSPLVKLMHWKMVSITQHDTHFMIVTKKMILCFYVSAKRVV